MTASLTLDNITKTVTLPDASELRILTDVSLSVSAGESVSIMGQSGSGKSTMLSIMGLLAPPSTGEVFVAGESASTLSDARLSRVRNEHCGYVFQNYSLIPTWNVAQNCQLPLLYRSDISARESRRRSQQALDLLGLGHRGAAMPRELSGGEQQRVAIARALVREPKVVLADEPTGALDQETAETVMRVLLAAVQHVGCSLVIVTHDEEVAKATEKQYVLSRGVFRCTS
ncbi:ABC transporter ATP-binding protein [Micrococcales bacterium 31B]|nr:ABC transporter ATP-binding protein [Micrococcales bacterium 31B]